MSRSQGQSAKYQKTTQTICFLKAFLSHHSFLGNEKPYAILVQKVWLPPIMQRVRNQSKCQYLHLLISAFLQRPSLPSALHTLVSLSSRNLYTPNFQRTLPPCHPKSARGLHMLKKRTAYSHCRLAIPSLIFSAFVKGVEGRTLCCLLFIITLQTSLFQLVISYNYTRLFNFVNHFFQNIL